MGLRNRARQHLHLPRQLYLERWLAGLVGGFLLCWLTVMPVQGQLAASDEASVVVDGRSLFEIASTDQVSAEERAETISRELQGRVNSGEPPSVTWELRNNAPVILVNGRYLMTVTQQDAALGEENTVNAQASEWAMLLDEKLNIAQQERSQAVLQRRALFAVALLVLAAVFHLIVKAIWDRLFHPFLEYIVTSQEDTNSPPAGFNLLSALLVAAFRFGLWFTVITYITDLFPFSRSWSYFLQQQARVGFLEPNLKLGQNEFSILSLVILLGLLLGLVVLSGILTNFIRLRVLRLTGINRGTREAISVLIKYTLIFIGAVVLLQVWGLDLSSLALIASALGVGIGLGLQNIAKDFGSGVILVFERPILVGDFVEFSSFQGTVEHIGARSTEIRTLDQISIIVPNSRFLEQEVINWSHHNPISRIRLPVGVAYRSKPDMVKDILIEVAYQHPHVLSKPPPTVFFTRFGDSALEFELLVWIADPPKQLLIKSDLYFSIESALRKSNIEIPFPQRDLHIRSSQVPVEFSSPSTDWAQRQTGPQNSFTANS